MKTIQISSDTTGPRIRAGALKGVVRGSAALSGNRKLLLAVSGIRLEEIAHPDGIVDAGAYRHLLLNAAKIGSSKQFALDCGLTVPIQTLGLAGQAILGAMTLRESLAMLPIMIRYFQSNSDITQSISNGRCRICYVPPFERRPGERSDMQFKVGLLANLVCAARHDADIDLVIGCPNVKTIDTTTFPMPFRLVSSLQGFVEFSSQGLSSKMPGSEPGKAEILANFMAMNPIDCISDWRLTQHVSTLVRISMGIEKPTQVRIADCLGLSVRTMQRALLAERTSFRKIVEAARMAIAREDLAAGKSVTVTAMKLGYDHPQNFSTAFQNWYGHIPSSVRPTPHTKAQSGGQAIPAELKSAGSSPIPHS